MTDETTDTAWQAELEAAREAAAGLLLEQPPTGKGVAPAGGTCRGCGAQMSDVLIDSGDNTGLHANCVDPPAPPSTIDEMEMALYRLDAGRARSLQTTLGPSELGTPCERQIAFKLAGMPQKDRGLAWAPLCGTAVHSLMEETLEQENERLGRERYFIETSLNIEDVVPDGTHVKGHGDAYDSDHALIIDWKYTGVTARRKAARVRVPNAEKVSQEYRIQTHLYGKGHENAQREVKWVRVVMLARSHDYSESVEWTERYRPDIAQWALNRYHRLRARVAAEQMAEHPERLAGVAAKPSQDTCKWCPFWRLNGDAVDATGCPGYRHQPATPESFLKG